MNIKCCTSEFNLRNNNKCYRLAAALYSIKDTEQGIDNREYGLLLKDPQHLEKNFIEIGYSEGTFSMGSRVRFLGGYTDMGALILQNKVSISRRRLGDDGIIIHMLMYTYDPSSVPQSFLSRHKGKIAVGTIVTGAVAAAALYYRYGRVR